MQTVAEELVQKAYGCLAGLALGDALGLPTEMLTPETISDWYGEIRGLMPIAARHPHHRLPRGSVSDDTDQALIIAQCLIEDGKIQPHRLAERLVAWGGTPRVRENNFLGRATRRALEALAAGTPVEEAGRGETIGAAMRIAPVALSCATRARLIEQVVAACMPTHYTQAAISGAMAVAFGVNAALEPGATTLTVAEAAGVGAQIGKMYGAWSWAPPLDRRIRWAMDVVKGMSLAEAAQFAYDVIGVGESPWELVTAAFVLLCAARGEPMPAMLAAVNCGGDADTLAAIIGALGGALSGIKALDRAMLADVCEVNRLDLAPIAQRLVSLRQA
jgi:ADP-ribosylglycohydrolase